MQVRNNRSRRSPYISHTCRISSAIAVLFSAAACDRTNWEPSIFRDSTFSEAGSGFVVTDAKQRLVWNVKNFRHKPNKQDKDPARLVCSEPSPDVAQALSDALKFSAEAALSQTSGTSKQISVDFARSFSSSVAQLGERLAVIQLMRDKMYRACEAYANGATSETGYTLMLARLDKTMTSLLSAEMAAGAFGRALASLGGSASVSGVDPAELEAAKSEVIAATKELENEAKKEYNADLAEDRKQRNKAVDLAAKDLNKAHTKLFALELQAARVASSSGVAGAGGQIGTIAGRAAGSDHKGLADAIVKIHQNFLDDDGIEPLTDACVVAMDRIKLSPEDANKMQVLLTQRNDAMRDNNSVTIKNIDEQIGIIYLKNGNAFAAYCMTNILKVSNDGIIDRRIKAKKDLRVPENHNTIEKRNFINLCEKILGNNTNTIDNNKKEVLVKCIEKIVELK